MDKGQGQIIHFKKRLKERFGLQITDEEIQLLIDRIQSKQATFIERRSRRTSKFEVELNNNSYIVVYDKKRKTLITALFK